MITYGAHCFIFTAHWPSDALAVLERAHALGLGCLELAVGDDVQLPVRELRQRAESLGMDLVVSPGCLWPVACDLNAESAADRATGLAWHQRQIDLAAALGATGYTGALYGHPGTVRKRRAPEAEWAWTAEGLHQLAAYGQAAGIPVVLEPMSHFRTHVINTPAQVMRMLDTVQHPNLQVLLDTYHMVTEVTDFGAAIRSIGDRLWAVHACDNHRGVPGAGILPWPAIFQALADIRFDGAIMLEAYNSADGDFAYSRGMFHDVCPDADRFVREGIAFLQTGLAGATAPADLAN